MKSTLLLLLLSTINLIAVCQSVGIGTSNPSPQAVLELSSVNKGILIPRLTATNRDNIQAPIPTGLLIYNSSVNKFQYYNGSWIDIQSATPPIVNCNFTTQRNIVVAYNSSTASAFYTNASGAGTWATQSLNGGTISSLTSSEQVVLFGAGYAYIFHINANGTGTWITRTLTGGTFSSIASDNLIVLYTSLTAYGIYQDCSGNSQWTQQALGGGAISTIASGTQIVLRNGSTAYAFSKNNNGVGTWTTQAISSINSANATYNTITLHSNGTLYGFSQNNSGVGSWTTTPYSGSVISIRTQ